MSFFILEILVPKLASLKNSITFPPSLSLLVSFGSSVFASAIANSDLDFEEKIEKYHWQTEWPDIFHPVSTDARPRTRTYVHTLPWRWVSIWTVGAIRLKA